MAYFAEFRRALEIRAHAVVNDVARNIAGRINKSEPLLNMKPEQAKSKPPNVIVHIKGGAELPGDKKSKVKDIISSAIQDSLEELP